MMDEKQNIIYKRFSAMQYEIQAELYKLLCAFIVRIVSASKLLVLS